MATFIFATNNDNKAKEIRAVLKEGFEILTLKEAGLMIDIPEPHDTLEKNASEKSRVIYELTRRDCFSEDTGLEVFSINNEPGVKSARYAQIEPVFDSNIDKLLFNLKDKTDRNARFRTIISLILEGKEFFFEGICNGHITEQPIGSGGFGYDPVFIPDGSNKTFAEMSMDEKNLFSHRKKAFAQLISFLNSHNGQD